MNVLHVAFGFLEWSDDVQSDNSFAPLILLEAQIEKRRTSEGLKFYGSSGNRVGESDGECGLKAHGYWVFGVS